MTTSFGKPLVLGLFAPLLAGQRGDRPGEQQALLPDSVVVPPAVVRTPAEELRTFEVAAGCRLELFASEPLVRDPVAATFDAAGRLWVVEMRSYMNDIEANGEDAPTGQIVVLHDDDDDGRADRSTVFADRLVLPRAVLPLCGGALVITPPELVWLRDDDGDLRADGRESIMGGFEAGLGNPEHCGNGLIWGFDHRIHLANDRRLLRRTADGFEIEQGAGGGQWGISHDDRGRCFFNYNSDWLRCDLVPGRYAARADLIGGLPAQNHRVVRDTSVWPIHITPGVNRGYQQGVLVDNVLAVHTAACAPLIYRGSWLPFDGDAFVCEPAGNVVRRFVLREHDGEMQGANAYQDARREFLASTDERFRPVYLLNGPDQALYVVDMYRGVIQHRNYVTTFLRDQVDKRQLARPVGLGRIWRIVPEKEPRIAPRNLQGAEPAALVQALTSDSGAVRDVALRELVQRRDRSAVQELRRVLVAHPRPAMRIALLSALAGLEALTPTDLRRAVRDPDRGVVAFALQYVGDELARGDPQLWAAIECLRGDAAQALRWHAALAIGDALVDDKLPRDAARRARIRERAFAQLATFVLDTPGDSVLCAAVATAAHPGIDEVLLRMVTAMPRAGEKSQADALQDLARRASKGRDAGAQQRVLDLAVSVPSVWQARALLLGIEQALPKGSLRAGWLVFGATPASLVTLSQHDDEQVRRTAQTLLGAVRIEGESVPGAVIDLTAAEQQRVLDGEKLYRSVCASCHQLDGRGQRGFAPPLRDSEWVVGPPGRLIRIALHGVKGPIEVDGEQWSLEMPGHSHLKDPELAQVLSYLRRAFGHQAGCIEVVEVQALRQANNHRAAAWTAAELLGTK